MGSASGTSFQEPDPRALTTGPRRPSGRDSLGGIRQRRRLRANRAHAAEVWISLRPARSNDDGAQPISRIPQSQSVESQRFPFQFRSVKSPPYSGVKNETPESIPGSLPIRTN